MDALAKFFEWLNSSKTAQCGMFFIAVALIAIIGLAIYRGQGVNIGPIVITPKPSAPPEKPSMPSEPSKPASLRNNEVVFICNINNKLHIYRDAQFPVAAGLPSDANIYILSPSNSRPIATERVILPDGVQSIEHLKFTVSFEYHADSKESPANLEFALKDANEQQIWRGTHSFLPNGPTKREESEEFSFNIGRSYADKQITVEIKPISAGDFGFYLSQIGGKLIVKSK